MGEDLNRSVLMELLEDTPPRPDLDTILFENTLVLAFFSQLQYADTAELHLSDSSSQEQAMLDCLRREFSRVNRQELAARFSYSERQVLRIVQKHTGLSFQKYIKQLRLDYIANQLVASDAPILQIIESAGYSNNNIFYDHFYERFGQTPTQYRAQNH